MKFCKQLTTDEQKSIEKILVKKIDQLFLYSQSKEFGRAFNESKNLTLKFCNMFLKLMYFLTFTSLYKNQISLIYLL